MEDKLNQILKNQILIMEEVLRETQYPFIKDEMVEAIEETEKILGLPPSE